MPVFKVKYRQLQAEKVFMKQASFKFVSREMLDEKNLVCWFVWLTDWFICLLFVWLVGWWMGRTVGRWSVDLSHVRRLVGS